MADRFNRLRHDRIVRGHNQHHDIRHLRARARIEVKAAWPGVSRKVISCRHSVDLIGADMLGDATGFA